MIELGQCNPNLISLHLDFMYNNNLTFVSLASPIYFVNLRAWLDTDIPSR